MSPRSLYRRTSILNFALLWDRLFKSFECWRSVSSKRIFLLLGSFDSSRRALQMSLLGRRSSSSSGEDRASWSLKFEFRLSPKLRVGSENGLHCWMRRGEIPAKGLERPAARLMGLRDDFILPLTSLRKFQVEGRDRFEDNFDYLSRLKRALIFPSLQFSCWWEGRHTTRREDTTRKVNALQRVFQT